MRYASESWKDWGKFNFLFGYLCEWDRLCVCVCGRARMHAHACNSEWGPKAEWHFDCLWLYYFPCILVCLTKSKWIKIPLTMIKNEREIVDGIQDPFACKCSLLWTDDREEKPVLSWVKSLLCKVLLCLSASVVICLFIF